MFYEYVEVCDFYSSSATFFEKAYIIYVVKSKISSSEKLSVVERRFSDFEWLHNFLTNELNYQVR